MPAKVAAFGGEFVVSAQSAAHAASLSAATTGSWPLKQGCSCHKNYLGKRHPIIPMGAAGRSRRSAPKPTHQRRLAPPPHCLAGVLLTVVAHYRCCGQKVQWRLCAVTCLQRPDVSTAAVDTYHSTSHSAFSPQHRAGVWQLRPHMNACVRSRTGRLFMASSIVGNSVFAQAVFERPCCVFKLRMRSRPS
jgi:hypothetical protein